MKSLVVFILASLVQIHVSYSQPPSGKLKSSNKILFYLHGGIVQEQGINAVSAQFGAYRYISIIDTLKGFGYTVISEARAKGTEEIVYAQKVAGQIDSLMQQHIAPENIVIIGASQGAYIAVEVAKKMKNPKINYVIMALCWEYSLNYFASYRSELCGNFLSIYESSDTKGSCDALLQEKSCKSGYKEIKLSMGNGHGFIYKPFPEWVLPLVAWIETY